MPDEKRETTSMIDMRMREHDRIDLLDGDWKPQILRLTFTAFSLKQTAVEKYGLTRNPQDVTRAGDLTRRADEFDFHDSLERRDPGCSR
jgi:hypothetical protein